MVFKNVLQQYHKSITENICTITRKSRKWLFVTQRNRGNKKVIISSTECHNFSVFKPMFAYTHLTINSLAESWSEHSEILYISLL